ncbi:hypothetical protein [Actinosynnema sp. NPDC020468]|uniref:ABC transporter substrate-binding protein n=1 Tax=Actinosynnema sp. NPDC020468 TaxID=3154488 RepID=UPI00340C6B6D
MIALIVSGLLLLAWVALIALRERRRRRFAGDIVPQDRMPRPVRVLLVVGLVLLPLASAVVAAPTALCFGGGFDPGVTLRGWTTGSESECVGVSDGGYDFSRGFADDEIGDTTRQRYREVLGQIKKQNDEVTGDYVKVAFLAPLTSPLSGPRVVHELAGLAAAQRDLNKMVLAPKIKLVLAHVGAEGDGWEGVVEDLIAMAHEDSVPLRAVVGLGLSQGNTKLATDSLSKSDIPMVADLITADNFGTTPLLYRAAFANTKQIDNSISALGNVGIAWQKGVVVRSKKKEDTYSQTLADHIRGKLETRTDPFDFDDEDADRLGSRFAGIVTRLCNSSQNPAVLFYAGRARYLSDLLVKLHDKQCEKKVIVVSASDAAVLRMDVREDSAVHSWGVQQAHDALQDKEVKLLFTPLADPDGPDNPSLTRLRDQLPDHVSDLNTGWAMMAWDALHVATQWIRGEQDDSMQSAIPGLTTVGNSSKGLFTSTKPYEGAGGKFHFEYGERKDLDQNAPVPVCLQSDGTVRPVTARKVGDELCNLKE